MCSEFSLNDELMLKFLSPSKSEKDKYINQENYHNVHEEEVDNNPAANFLSTFIKIYPKKNNWYVLLTADSEKNTFIRIIEKESQELNGKLILAQIPHHGSVRNFSHPFWQNIKRESGTPVVISVGKNKYKHPSEEVLRKLRKINYSIHSTNSTNTMSSIVTTNIQVSLDVFSYAIPDLSLKNKLS